MTAGLRTTINKVSLAAIVLITALSLPALAADSPVQATLDTSKAGPRAVELQTQQAVLRDYRFAWSSLAQALEFDTADPLEGPFTGSAKKWISNEVHEQQQNGLISRYESQRHKVQAVFYAPEGDVIELHDTAEYQWQVIDGQKQIQDQHVVVRYVVLMTPAADRWVVRQLQAVPEF